MQPNDKFIKYTDLEDEIFKYTNYIVWSGSDEDKINRWLKPIYYYAKENSQFYNGSKERDCGWYIAKDEILNMLHNNKPDLENEIFNNKVDEILNDLWDFIVDYKEPQMS